jgi:hypothetical protein
MLGHAITKLLDLEAMGGVATRLHNIHQCSLMVDGRLGWKRGGGCV